MRRVLIDDDERIVGLGDDESVVKLRPRRAERIGRFLLIVGVRVPRVSPLGSASGESGACARSAKPNERAALP